MIEHLWQLWARARNPDEGQETETLAHFGVRRIVILALILSGVAAIGYLDRIQTQHWDLTLLYAWLVITSGLLLPRRVALGVACAAALVAAAAAQLATGHDPRIGFLTHSVMYLYIVLVTTELDRERRKLLRQSRIDDLTGFHNWRALREQLRDRIALAKRTGRPLTVLMLDLDGFKRVNDLYGHAAGNQLLRDTASFIRATTRLGDGLFRFGGDEFVILLPDTDASGGAVVAERVHDSARRLGHGFPAEQVEVGLSIGIAGFPSDAEEMDDLLGKADAALYRAKRTRTHIVAAADPPESEAA
jgi:diguanylate cyclase (GGDEF)-like protein